MVNIFKQMTPAMIGYLTGLIYRNTRSSCCCLASLSAMTHDRFYRLLYADFPFSRRLWEWFASRLVGAGGYLIVDDTAWQRFTRRAEAVSFVWDSQIGKVVFGMNVVLLIWTDGKRKVPLGLRVWQKGGHSKIELACEMFTQARACGVKPVYVLFDSWYSCNKLLNLLDSFGWHYIGRAKVNRVLDRVKIGAAFRHRFGRKVGALRRVSHQNLIVKDGRRFWLTNDLSLTSKDLKRHYRFRQQVEETFRLLKQEFGWSKCQAGTKKAQNAHLHLGLYALCLVQIKAGEETVYHFKQNLFCQAIPTQQQFVELFTAIA